jgi:hypothetical protein
MNIRKATDEEIAEGQAHPNGCCKHC